LCKRIRDTAVTIDEWNRQKAIQNAKQEADIIDLAFSTFFLNRTNRSGIIRGGIIGGTKQDGPWKMDVRYNKDDLIKRIEKITLYKNRIALSGQDAIKFLRNKKADINNQTLIYFDPPYFKKGSGLYANFYTVADHEKLAKFIINLKKKWILTYDYVPEIIEMYNCASRKLLHISYTASNKRMGTEMIAFSDKINVPYGNYGSIKIEDTVNLTKGEVQ
jgi:DNA adenine methylase